MGKIQKKSEKARHLTAPLTVEFADLSANDPTSWSWEFGDGAASTMQNPNHQYEDAGRYTVSLTATNVHGSDTETKLHYVMATFSDVGVGQWACDEIMACAEAGIVVGYSDGSYQPDWTVDRAQMAVYVARALAGSTG